MRYFFHAIGGRVYEDKDGEEFAENEDAMTHAMVIARELAEDVIFDGFWIVVVDGEEDEIGRVPIVSRRSLQ